MSAQSSPQGVPQELLEAKKAELIQEKVCGTMVLGICCSIHTNISTSSSKKTLQNKRDSAAKNSIVAIVTWTTYATVSATIVAEEAATVAAATAGVEAETIETLEDVAEEEAEETLAAVVVAGTLIAGQDAPDRQTHMRQQEEGIHMCHADAMEGDTLITVDRLRRRSALCRDPCQGLDHHHAVVALRVAQ